MKIKEAHISMSALSLIKPWLLILLSYFVISGCWKKKEEQEEFRMADTVVEMQRLVEEISEYARSRKPGFIILPQNGPELAFVGADPANNQRESYIRAIDGFAVEELFYNGSYQADRGRVNMLTGLKSFRPIFVSDYISDSSLYAAAWDTIAGYGFIPFIRTPSNYYYEYLPPSPSNANQNTINTLAEARNFLYLLSSNRFPDRQTYLQQLADRQEDVLIIDAEYMREWLTPQEVALLQKKPNGVRRLVIAYMNIGAAERYRYYWKSNWRLGNPVWIRKPYPGYPDEYYVAYWYPEWKSILFGNPNAYLDRILAAGFDGVFLDNVEAYYHLLQ